jgi:release factor glutamine methyltransferase
VTTDRIIQSPEPTVSQLIRGGELELVVAGVPNARRNAEWMLSHVLGCRAADLYLDTQQRPQSGLVHEYRRLVARRAGREPLQYLLGTTEFMSLPFLTVPGVFIPRPDTECLAEIAESMTDPHAAVLDLCCGSGVIGISLLHRSEGTRLTAVDVDASAVALTRRNAALNGVSDRMVCELGDGIAFLRDVTEPFDVIVCNPPYIASEVLSALPPEVRNHEPRTSLDGGPEGLSFYRDMAPLLPRALRPGAPVLLEIGADQAAAVSAILADAGLVDIAVDRDYAGCDRVVSARRARNPKAPEENHG